MSKQSVSQSAAYAAAAAKRKARSQKFQAAVAAVFSAVAVQAA